MQFDSHVFRSLKKKYCCLKGISRVAGILAFLCNIRISGTSAGKELLEDRTHYTWAACKIMKPIVEKAIKRTLNHKQ